jgi:DNA repair photolyase
VSPARVYVYSCPYCYASDYLTTHPDNTPLNNLLDLPRY